MRIHTTQNHLSQLRWGALHIVQRYNDPVQIHLDLTQHTPFKDGDIVITRLKQDKLATEYNHWEQLLFVHNKKLGESIQKHRIKGFTNLPQLRSDLIQALRQPLENNKIWTNWLQNLIPQTERGTLLSRLLFILQNAPSVPVEHEFTRPFLSPIRRMDTRVNGIKQSLHKSEVMDSDDDTRPASLGFGAYWTQQARWQKLLNIKSVVRYIVFADTPTVMEYYGIGDKRHRLI